MSDYNSDGDLITIVDDDGQEFELEYIDEIDYNGSTFVAFLPANMDESDPDYGLIILRSVPDENGEELFESIDDEATQSLDIGKEVHGLWPLKLRLSRP